MGGGRSFLPGWVPPSAGRLTKSGRAHKRPARWARYILDSLIETTLSRDVPLLARIDKPVLQRRLFHLVRRYSGQMPSFTKILGQVQDAGNTTTLAQLETGGTCSPGQTDLLTSSGTITYPKSSSPHYRTNKCI